MPTNSWRFGRATASKFELPRSISSANGPNRKFFRMFQIGLIWAACIPEVAGALGICLSGCAFPFAEEFLLTLRPLPLILVGLQESDLNLRLMLGEDQSWLTAYVLIVLNAQ
jgi:hypothetical protein